MDTHLNKKECVTKESKQDSSNSDMSSGVSNQIGELEAGSPEDSSLSRDDDYSSDSDVRSMSSDPTEELNLQNKLEVELCTLQKG